MKISLILKNGIELVREKIIKYTLNKNVSEHTLKKKLSNDDLKNYKKAVSNLCACGIIEIYRNENFTVPKQGRRITDEIVEQKRQNKYVGLRILMLQV